MKNRADFIIYWGGNPADCHPLHFSRYTLIPKGKHVPEGRKGRTMVLVDVRETPSAKHADILLQVKPGKDFEVVTTLRALVKNQPVDAARVAETGLTLEQLQDLVDRMKNARFGVIFFGMGVSMTRGKHMNSAAILSLVAELNADPAVHGFLVIPRLTLMNQQTHEHLKSAIWEIANRLRGPYRPPQYRLVMLPMVVLRRLDCVVEERKEHVLAAHEKLKTQNHDHDTLVKLLGRAADPNRQQALYNISPFTFDKLLGDPDNIAPNLVAYINGFSPIARSIFEQFGFTEQIEKLDSSNRLFTIVKEMAALDLHPDRIDSLQMGYLFEHLVIDNLAWAAAFTFGNRRDAVSTVRFIIEWLSHRIGPIPYTSILV